MLYVILLLFAMALLPLGIIQLISLHVRFFQLGNRNDEYAIALKRYGLAVYIYLITLALLCFWVDMDNLFGGLYVFFIPGVMAIIYYYIIWKLDDKG